MAVQLTIPYETLIVLIDQLPAEEQDALVNWLLSAKRAATLSKSERLAAYHASIISNPIREAPSIRREDWYDDDGR